MTFAIVLVKPIVQWFLLESCVNYVFKNESWGVNYFAGGEVSTCANEEFSDRTIRTSFLFIVIKAYYNGC